MNANYYEKNTEKTSQQKQSALFNLAIIIMGVVSCYTTALGLEPMLGNRIFSFAVAAALSLIMIAIALQLPKAYQENRQTGMILSYVFVASFSVLLNYNFIFGKFSSEKILYKELEEHKLALTNLMQQGETEANQYYQVETLASVAKEKRSIANEEYQNNVNPGKGKIHRQKDQAARLAENRLRTAQENVRQLMIPIEAEVDSAIIAATSATDVGDWETYRSAIPSVTATYNRVGNRFSSELSDFNFQARRFENRDIGQLSHSLGSIFSYRKNGGDAFAVIVALVLAILIDFIILFAIIVINRPATAVAAKRKKDNKAFQGFLTSKKISEEPLVLERNY